jgi:PAS domain S-box-containing protein
MNADLQPLFFGTALACLGLSALRLARIDRPARGWTRLCVAGLAGALLEWYQLYSSNLIAADPNDLPGSVLALVALVALLEFSRRALAKRFNMGLPAQIIGGVLIAAAAVITLAVGEGGIYDRLVFSLRTLGLLGAALALLLMRPRHEKLSRWTRLSGASWLASVILGSLTDQTWLLVVGTFLAAGFLRTLYIKEHRDNTRSYTFWALAEIISVAVLLGLASWAADRRGNDIIRLEGLQFIHLTETAAAALAPADVAALTGTAQDTAAPAFERISQRLLAIQKLARAASQPETSSRFAYLMAARGPDVVFLADQPYDSENPVQPGDSYAEASPELRQALVDGQPFLEGPLPDKFGVWVSAFAPVRDASGQLLALLGIDFDARDWSSLEQSARLASLRNWTLLVIIALSIFTSVGLSLEAQQQLRRSAQMLRIAADYTATWEYWVGPDGQLRHTSPAVEKITGYRPSDFLHHPRRLLKITAPEDRQRLAAHLRTCSHDSPACEFDFKIRRKDGATAWIKHTCQSVYDEDGRWNGRRASNRDITALRSAELTLARQERLQRGCQQSLRRLLGREGARYTKDALEIAGEAGGCSCVALMHIRADLSLEPVAFWPADQEPACPLPWETLQSRAMPILTAGEVFEILPRETRGNPGPMSGAHIAMLPLLEAGKLRGFVAFAAPATRDPWSRAELAALATLANGLSVAMSRSEHALD